LYLMTDERATRAHMAGLRAAGYLAQTGHPYEVAHTVSRSPEILEQSVNALCGSLIGFTADGAPVLDSRPDSPTQDQELREVQHGIQAFQHRWNRYAAQAHWPELIHGARPRLAHILVSALQDPTVDEARMFGNWEHEDNFGSTVVTQVMPDDLTAA